MKRASQVWNGFRQKTARKATRAAILAVIALGNMGWHAAVHADEVADAIAVVQKVQPGGVGHPEAMAAVKSLGGLPASELPRVLDGFAGAGPLAKNWLRGVVGEIANREKTLPVDALNSFLADQNKDPDARAWVFEKLTAGKPELRSSKLAEMLEDRSLDLRYLAVEQSIEKGNKLIEAGDKQGANVVMMAAFQSARHPEQLKSIAGKLKELGLEVDLAKQFGFLPKWQVVGPFDNRNEAGFDVAYDPEKEIASAKGIDLSAQYSGKESAKVNWKEIVTDSPEGAVDLNPAYQNEKGAIVYAYVEFDVVKAMDADFRLGCINANKLWLNGEQLMANQVYHASTSIDQYIAQGKLKEGKNTLLVKVCQNEQTEAWAQDFMFQLRVCDSTGKAILSRDRK